MKKLFSNCSCTKNAEVANKDLEMSRDDFNTPGYTPTSKSGYQYPRNP